MKLQKVGQQWTMPFHGVEKRRPSVFTDKNKMDRLGLVIGEEMSWMKKYTCINISFENYIYWLSFKTKNIQKGLSYNFEQGS